MNRVTEAVRFGGSKEKEVLSSIQPSDPISVTATAANGALCVATMTHVYKIKAPKSELMDRPQRLPFR